MVAPPIIAILRWVHLPVSIAPLKILAAPQSAESGYMPATIVIYYYSGWLRSSVVRTSVSDSLTDELSLASARSVADVWPLMWV